MKLNWECPFCSHKSIVHDGETGTLSLFGHQFNQGNRHSYQVIRGRVIVCPNDDCKEYALDMALHDQNLINHYLQDSVAKRTWTLIPDSKAKVFPDYIPKPILDDYREACLICELSPKASATLSRRCLQGIIRGFWGVSKARLVDEINEIKDRMDVDTWEAIDAVRQIGNIGAHMEKDINLVVDVEPEEARILIGLIETLLTDWYVAKHERQQRMQKLKEIAEEKKAQRTPPAP